jgi:hypothetical protein
MLDPRIDDSIDLIRHGEPGVAFENLASNVYEYALTLSVDEYDAFQLIGSEMGLSASTWTFLAELVVESA